MPGLTPNGSLEGVAAQRDLADGLNASAALNSIGFDFQPLRSSAASDSTSARPDIAAVLHLGPGFLTRLMFGLLGLLSFLATFVPTRAAAQSLDVVLDASTGSGVLLGSGDGETEVGRTPWFLQLDAGFIFDGDTEIEWVLGSTLQLEDRPALGFTPGIRLLRPAGPVEFFGEAGVPVFVVPFTRLGLELAGGALYRLFDRVALIGQLAIDVFFAGSDIPADTAVIMFNLGLGGRVYF
ncbi:MAG: hypothetical protein KC620_24150 [Myxococcales bacterium]|nr:hypothetical protein [Myxococcales bacterium]